jgi:hypothetical protein
LSGHNLNLTILAGALFMRGMGMSAVGIPSISAAYAAVRNEDLPMATTSLNIVQHVGGPTLTTFCATLLGWRLEVAHSHSGVASAFTHAGPAAIYIYRPDHERGVLPIRSRFRLARRQFFP